MNVIADFKEERCCTRGVTRSGNGLDSNVAKRDYRFILVEILGLQITIGIIFVAIHKLFFIEQGHVPNLLINLGMRELGKCAGTIGVIGMHMGEEDHADIV